MRPGARVLQAAALAIAAVLYGLAADQALLGASLGALLLLAAGALALTGARGGPGLPLGPLAQGALALVALPAAWALTPASAPGSSQLGPFWSSLAALCLVLALPRPFLARPVAGHAGTLGLGLVCVLASGGARTGAVYPTLMGAFLLAAVVALSAADPGRPRWRALGLRHRVAGTVGLTVAGALAVSAALALPAAHDWAIRKLGLLASRSTSGFSESLQLGGLTDLLLSDTPVMRLWGPRPDYLRGAAYDQYFKGSWLARQRTRATPLAPTTASTTAPAAVEMRAARDLDGRVFLPLDARRLEVPGARLRADNWGLVTVGPGETFSTARFELGPRDRGEPAPPSDLDTEVPRELRPVLTALAFDWTEGAPGDEVGREERLAALVGRFHEDFAYALESDHRGRMDPVMHFLLEERRGHCEYFASAFALLARSLGIPARVVGGYRVTELNPVGGYWLVRERDAHAWVEAWLPGRGWVTYEPTPPSGLAEPGSVTTAWWSGALDAASAWWRGVMAALGGEDPISVVALGAGPLLVLLVLLRLRGRVRRRRGGGVAPGEYSPAPPCLDTLSRALAAAGLTRAPSEPIEAFAERAAAHESLGPRAGEAADLLRAYAAWRYGGAGDEAELARRIQRFAEPPPR